VFTQFQLGNRLLVKKEYEAAIRAFLAHAAEVPSEAPRGYVQAAECLRHTNVLKAPIEVEPGVRLVSAGDREGARAMYRRALAIDPCYYPALRGLAQVLDKGSVEQRSILETAVGLRADPLLVDMLGRLYEESGAWSDAIALYRRALDYLPGDRHVLDALARAERGSKG
jgi:tetratricopeptide (TPR) repeat protein